MPRTVHRFHPVFGIVAVLHPGVHVLCEVVEVPRGLPKICLGHMWGKDEIEPVALVESTAVVLHDLAKHSALGVPNR